MKMVLRAAVAALASSVIVFAAAAPAHAHWGNSVGAIERALQFTKWSGQCGDGLSVTCVDYVEGHKPNAWPSDWDKDYFIREGQHSYQFRGKFYETKFGSRAGSDPLGQCRTVYIRRANVSSHEAHSDYPHVWRDRYFQRENRPWRYCGDSGFPWASGSSSTASAASASSADEGTGCWAPGFVYKEQCPGDEDSSNVSPAGFNYLSVDPDSEIEETHSLAPDAITYSHCCGFNNWGGFNGTSWVGANAAFLSAESDPSDVQYVHDFDTSEYDGRIDFSLTDLPAGSAGTYTAEVRVRVKQAFSMGGDHATVRLLSSTGTVLGSKVVYGPTDGVHAFTVTGLSVSALDGAKASIYKAWAGESTRFYEIDVVATKTG
jgi:hypothetical protein